MRILMTANELKTKGVSRLEEVTAAGEEAVTSVHGKDRFVVPSMEQYLHLRACDLEAAITETKRDLAEGHTIQESVEDHIKRVAGAWNPLHRVADSSGEEVPQGTVLDEERRFYVVRRASQAHLQQA